MVGESYVLVTCVCKDNDRKRCKGGNWARPFEDTDCATVGECVAFDVMCYDENNKVGDREEGNDAGVFE